MPKKAKAKGPTIPDLGEIGECLHTALRKCCDSKATSIAWNAISLLTDTGSPVWGRYLEGVQTALKAKRATLDAGAAVAFVVKQASLDLNTYPLNNHMRLTNILRCAFELFTWEDWLNYTRMLWDKGWDAPMPLPPPKEEE